MRRVIDGTVVRIEGDVAADAILAPRHLAEQDPEILAAQCLAGVPGAEGLRSAARPVLVVTGLFGVGLVRPPVLQAMRAAGIAAVIAPALSPLFSENALNGFGILPVEGRLAPWPVAGAAIRLDVTPDRIGIAWDGGAAEWSCATPAWALDGEGWVETLRRRAEAAGGLHALQERMRGAV